MPLNSGTYANNEEQIYHILKANGFNLAVICGILSNIESECNFNPAAYNSREGAYGICQWRSGRKNNLFTKYTSKPSLYDQVKFISDELNSSESRAKRYLDQVSNTRNGAYDAGYDFADKYERCADQYNVPRANRATAYWDYYNDPTRRDSMVPAGDLKFIDRSTTTENVSKNVSSYGNIVKKELPTLGSNFLDVSRRLGNSKYGYLVDITYGGEFKFFLPEFTETAGANWEDINIPGRSVSIKSYNNTNSRKVTITLELYAGVGLYNSTTDPDIVGTMHADANFVKSLEYPDYSQSVTNPPATVHLILGSTLAFAGVVTEVSVEHMKPLDSQGRAMYLKLSFTVTQVSADPPGWRDIRGTSTTNTTLSNINTLPERMRGVGK